MFVHKYLILLGKECPYSDVKLSLFKQQRSFNIFLNNTTSIKRSWCDKVKKFINIREYLDASALISIGRFYKPNVINTMLNRDSFFWSIALSNVSISLNHFLLFRVFHTWSNEKSCRSWIKNWITTLPS